MSAEVTMEIITMHKPISKHIRFTAHITCRTYRNCKNYSPLPALIIADVPHPLAYSSPIKCYHDSCIHLVHVLFP